MTSTHLKPGRVIKAEELTTPPPRWQPDPPSKPAVIQAPAPTSSSSPGPEADLDLDVEGEVARRKGLADGIRTAEEAYREKLARLDALAASLAADRQEFFDRIEPELVRLSIVIAEKVIGHELELAPETVVDIVRSAMKRLRERETLRVSVNPRDLDTVKNARDDLIGAVDGVRKLEVVEDRRVDPGGCVIESPSGTLDARMKTQIDEISRALGEAVPEAEEPDASGS
jgi:flagellar assembly protein FliH